ncbi:potassium channel family protein [Umezakia ovalisporum]|uniref:potassium channel family protein n=1 Tax=Umezakia ovalisporum TaxID=75695 RepID=UPI002474B8D5|nr:potassium channel protein [Umezakia ovalisporum]MDH6068875.1 potassium channel protein [Umezakia ovalisporum APH033B]MDH6077219.1 potassium channel protein [Umezakia ovalisporum FSS-45]MDH6083453.1 potassium channel protein [Umezakia ovalisporum TAC611]MDH6089640.1 potassium channel protein [Umezakia ovalisporum Ak1311]MDH6101752.1 potassium channel protein [Umezakia ovalisporum ANA283AFssAo]
MYSALEKKYRRLQQELTIGVISLGGVFLVGTLWYKFMEGWSWEEAAYMTVITLTTVGYGETNPLSSRGRLFTIALIMLGVINIGYIVNRFTEAVIQGYFQEGIRLRQQKRLMESLTQHYIICGFSRTGRQIAKEFEAEGVPFVVVDSDPDSVEQAQAKNYIAYQGDVTLDDTLLKVAVQRAICIVAALPSDAENLYTVLTAKTLNPAIRAIARASTEESVKKLQRGGADIVVSPYITGGKRMAAAALRPQVLDFVDGFISGQDRQFYMEEFLVDPLVCPLVGNSLKQAKLRSQSGALVIAIRRADGHLIGGPTGDAVLLPGDTLICMGTSEQLRNLNQILMPINSQKRQRPRNMGRSQESGL